MNYPNYTLYVCKWNVFPQVLVARCEHDAVLQGPQNETQFLTIKALNEWDSKVANGVEWRQKLDTQRGAVLANELRNNSCKLAKWTVQVTEHYTHLNISFRFLLLMLQTSTLVFCYDVVDCTTVQRKD